MGISLNFRSIKLSCLSLFRKVFGILLEVVGAILICFWYILFCRFPPNICESFNLCSFVQAGF